MFGGMGRRFGRPGLTVGGRHSIATNSLLLASASSQSLTATGKITINQQKFTFAFWFKTTTAAAQEVFYFGDGTNANRAIVLLNASGQVDFLAVTASTTIASLVTSAAYNDGNWHSAVIAVDTTQATANNRVIIYVDGAIAALGTNTQPSQNANLSNNFSTTYRIGSNQTPASFFNGKLALPTYIDGQQRTASDFRSPTTGLPINYTGGFTGVFDFVLPFSNAGSLGADQSGESNNWTPVNAPTQSGDHP